MEILEERFSRALCVVAHPDDLEYGASSAVARWTSAGKRVVYLLATSGEAGIAHLAPEVAGPLREREERQSAVIVGVDEVEFLGLTDGSLEYGLDLRRRIAGAIRRHQPEIVVTMNFELSLGAGAVNHADHRAVGLATLDACRDAANGWLFPELGRPWSVGGGVYVMGSTSPTHYVDVEATIGRGVDSLRAHGEYLAGLGGDTDPNAFLRDMAASSGERCGCRYACLFQRFEV